jgi:hypothetical protein
MAQKKSALWMAINEEMLKEERTHLFAEEVVE